MKRSFWINLFSRNKASNLLILICFCLIVSNSAKADWISVCQNSFKPAQASFQKDYYKSNGDIFWLSISQEKQAACKNSMLPAIKNDLLWMGLISVDVASRLDDRPILHGFEEDGQLKISEIVPQLQKAIKNVDSLRNIPLNVNALDDIEARMFGVEERVRIQKKSNSLSIQCDAGSKPAGALLKIDKTRLPSFSSPTLSLSYRGDGVLQFGLSDQQRFDKGAPIILGELNAKMALSHQQYLIPSKINRNSQLHLSVICPKQAATLLIEDLQFVVKSKLQKSPGRGMWFWRPALWQEKPIELLKQAEKYNANRIFISIELDEQHNKIKQQAELEAFIRLAADKNIAVWVVEGDPRVVLPAERARFVDRSRIYATFNTHQAKNLKLAGIQYDIEPYLVSGYALEVDKWAQAYVDTISQLHDVANMPLEIVIPFWWRDQMLGDKSLLDHLVPHVESINVMNYRTSENLLERFAQPLLAWGERNNRQVSVALEVGPLVEEQQWRFNKVKNAKSGESSGELWQIQVEEHHVLIYLDQAMSNPDATVFKRVASRDLSVDTITFKAKIPELMRLLPSLEQSWENWPSFSGVSLHGLDDLSRSE